MAKMLDIGSHEEQVIGFILLNSDTDNGSTRRPIVEAVERLTQEDFMNESCGLLFRAVREYLLEHGSLPPLLAAKEKALSYENSNFCGLDDARIGEVMTFAAASLPSFDYAVRHIMEESKRNTYAVEASLYADKIAHLDGKRLEEVSEEHCRRLDEIADSRTDEHIGSTLADMGKELLEHIESGKIYERIETGFKTLDKIIDGGFSPGTLNILAARPSVGKTAMMLQMSLNAARNARPALIFSLEMTTVELAKRLYRLENPHKVELDDRETVVRFFDELSGLPLIVCDKGATVDNIVYRIRTLCRRYGIKIVFIDYIGLIARSDGPESIQEYLFLDEISRRLKDVAKKEDIAVVLLAQLNREQAKADTPPRIDHLRGSGGLEQNADVIQLLWRPDNDDREHVELIVGKNRNGAAGDKIQLYFDGAKMKFEEQNPRYSYAGGIEADDEDGYRYLNTGGFE